MAGFGTPPQIPPIDGAAMLHSLLALLANPQEFGKRLAQLEQARAAANGAIEDAGLAGDIMALRNEAERDRRAAAGELEVARDDASQIMDRAVKTAAGVLKAAEIQREQAEANNTISTHAREAAENAVAEMQRQAREKLAEADAAVASKKAWIEDQTRLMEVAKAEVTRRQSELEQAIAAAEASRAEYEKKLADIRRIAGG